MTSKIENHNALIRELNDGDLDRVSGGTSGFMYAVAAAAYKFVNDATTNAPIYDPPLRPSN
jgi:hypothetical protein